MRLSIIIPVFNEADSIVDFLSQLQSTVEDDKFFDNKSAVIENVDAEAINSKKNNIEIIVVDGESQDGTLQLAEPLVSQTLTSEKGRALQMNAGAAVAAGDYFIFLHADTTLPKNFYTQLKQIIADRQSVWGFFSVRLSGESFWFRIIERAMCWRSRITSVATGDQALFVSRQLFYEVDGYPSIPLMEDVAISKQLRGYVQPSFVDKPVTTDSRRWEKNGIVKTILLMWWLRLNYFLGVDPHKLEKMYR